MRIGLGCVNLASASRGRSTKADVRLVHAAIDHGVRVFDTADSYGSGTSERVLGRAVKNRRDGLVIATKGGYVFRPRHVAEQTARRYAAVAKRSVDGLRSPAGGADAGGSPGPVPGAGSRRQDFSVTYLRGAVDASLRRLGTDHIDVYQLHGPHELFPDLFEQLAGLVTAGKVGRFGIGAESVAEAAAWAPIDDVAVLQVPFGVLDPEAAADVFPAIEGRDEGRDVEIWARGVLGGGVMAAAIADPGAIADHPKRPLVASLQEVASRHGIGLDELAVGFARTFTPISTVLLGMSTPEHLRRNLELVAREPLDPDVLADVRSLIPWTGSGDG
jgi:aryl-alcohol dehydrogenase-like predicted oxidoreductase